ncbi:MAG: hypothetical protein BWY17_05321 [Deltaproteobacteria bacterium ADurb.Bin207]|nr:MAG: hypothetical protein BWY17_05321 [Deltaproteobacteria bacterium ADurb.Bin207]
MIPRDSLYAERIHWTGAPTRVVAAPLHRSMAWLLSGMSVIATLFAIAGSQVQSVGTGKLVLFAAWTATFALLVRTLPVWWAQAARFTVTDRHVIWQSGHFKRTVQRKGISFARITWHRRNPRVGDLDLVRAVPTGALHRRLTLTLQGIGSPHRVWSIVRGAQAVTGQSDGGNVPPEQRLDEGEAVQWQAAPQRSWRTVLPLTTRRTLTTALGVLCLMMGVRTIFVGASTIGRLLEAGLSWGSLGLLSLLGGIGLTVVMLVLLGVWFLHVGMTRKPWMDTKTRYLLTNQRFIMVRGRQELHIHRAAIVDMADRKGLYGGHDVYLILDGPQSRALSAQGAFGPAEGVRGFRPMLQAMTAEQVQSLRAALFESTTPSSPQAPPQS